MSTRKPTNIPPIRHYTAFVFQQQTAYSGQRMYHTILVHHVHVPVVVPSTRTMVIRRLRVQRPDNHSCIQDVDRLRAARD